jgi:hypothetical protein
MAANPRGAEGFSKLGFEIRSTGGVCACAAKTETRMRARAMTSEWIRDIPMILLLSVACRPDGDGG